MISNVRFASFLHNYLQESSVTDRGIANLNRMASTGEVKRIVPSGAIAYKERVGINYARPKVETAKVSTKMLVRTQALKAFSKEHPDLRAQLPPKEKLL